MIRTTAEACAFFLAARLLDFALGAGEWAIVPADKLRVRWEVDEDTPMATTWGEA